MRRAVLVVVVAVIVSVGLMLSQVVNRPDRGAVSVAFGQGSGDETAGPPLGLTDPFELDVFEAWLNDAELKGGIETKLSNGWDIRFVGFALDSTQGNGDKTFFGAIGFKSSGGTLKLFKSSYFYDHNSGANPSIPPDDVTQREVTPAPTPDWADVVIPDQKAFDYLLYVLDESNRPSELDDAFPAMDLTCIWGEHVSSQSKVKMFFKYTDATSTQTILCWSIYSQAGFGTIHVVN